MSGIREIRDEHPEATTWKVLCDGCHVLGSNVRARTLSIGNVDFLLCGKCWRRVRTVTSPRPRWGQSQSLRRLLEV